jgi:hypothetical protein
MALTASSRVRRCHSEAVAEESLLHMRFFTSFRMTAAVDSF